MVRKRQHRDATVAPPGIGWRAAVIALAVALTYANSLHGPFVIDDQAAIVQNEQIRELYRKHHRDLLIETVATIPGDQAERVKAMPREERAKFFRNWATDRADVAVVHGVYILICKEPPFVEIIVTQRGRQAFDKETFEKLRDLLLKAFREKRYDEGLQNAVDLVRDRFAAAATKEPQGR